MASLPQMSFCCGAASGCSAPRLLLGCNKRLLARNAEATPVHALRHHALVRSELDVRNARLRIPPLGADRRPALLELLRRSHHHAAKLRHREVARAEMV